MFDFVHKHKKIIQLVLALMFIPFMFSGVSSLTIDSIGGDVVAKVGKKEITKTAFEENFKRYLDSTRAQMGDKYNESQFDTPEQRTLLLNEMIDQYAVEEAARAEYLTVSDSQLLAALLKDPIVSKDAEGKVDKAKYQALLKANHMTEAEYEAGVRARLSSSLVEKIATSGYGLTPLQQSAISDILTQVRLVEIRPIDLAPYMAKVTITPEQSDQYYKTHSVQFNKPELFDVEYAVIPVLPANYVPNDTDIKAAFGGTPTAADIEKVKKDPALLQEALKKTAAAKMESVAKNIDAASAKAPQDLAAIVSQFGGKVESIRNLTRQGDDPALPEVLKSADARLSIITGSQVVSKAISSPVRASETSLIVGRVVKQTPAGMQAFADVKEEIEKTLKQEAVVVQARADAQKQIAAMSPEAAIGAKIAVGPLLKSPFDSATMAQVLGLGAKDMPKLIVSEDASSVSIIRVIGNDPNKPAADKFVGLKPSLDQWGGVAGILQQRAYINVLRERLGVKIYPERLGGADKAKT